MPTDILTTQMGDQWDLPSAIFLCFFSTFLKWAKQRPWSLNLYILEKEWTTKFTLQNFKRCPVQDTSY